MPYKFVEFVPLSHFEGNCTPSATMSVSGEFSRYRPCPGHARFALDSRPSSIDNSKSPTAKALIQSAPVGDRPLRADHHHLAVPVGKAEHQDFGHELADLLGREIGRGRTSANTLIICYHSYYSVGVRPCMWRCGDIY